MGLPTDGLCESGQDPHVVEVGAAEVRAQRNKQRLIPMGRGLPREGNQKGRAQSHYKLTIEGSPSSP